MPPNNGLGVVEEFEMTIAFGRRRLILSLMTTPISPKSVDLPMAQNASDNELAQLTSLKDLMEDRRRWEASAILFGGMRPR